MEMREKIQSFMYGRYGSDQLIKFESSVMWIPIILLFFVRNFTVRSVLLLILLALSVHMYGRMLSKNIAKRTEENQKFLELRYKVIADWYKFGKKREQKRIYRFYKCPMCKQQVRVPKGHGRIEITCPKCREHFVKRS